MNRVDHPVTFDKIVEATAKGVNKIATAAVQSDPTLRYGAR